jgi:hypothetical protein
MRIKKIYAALILASLATGVIAQTTALQSAASDASQGRIQLAQAGSGPNSQGSGQGSQGGPGKAPGGQGGGEHHHGPPSAAIAACKGLASGAGCSFIGRQNQNLSGTCFSPKSDKPLACRPAGGARGGQGGPGAAKS